MKRRARKFYYDADVNYDLTLGELAAMTRLRINRIDLEWWEDHCSKKEEKRNAKRFVRICFGRVISTAQILEEFGRMELRVPTIKEALTFHIKHSQSHFFVLDRIFGDGTFQGREMRHRPFYLNFVSKFCLSGSMTFCNTPYDEEIYNQYIYFLGVKE